MGFKRNAVRAGLHTSQVEAVFGADSIESNITAAGTNQATAYPLTKVFNIVTNVAAGTGVRLPVAESGDRAVILNRGANALAVYPPSGGRLNNAAVDAAVSVAAGKCAIAVAYGERDFVLLLSA